MENTTKMSISSKKILEARIFWIFNNPHLKKALKSLMYLVLLFSVIIFVAESANYLEKDLNVFYFFVIFIVLFILYNFSSGYLKDLEKKQMLHKKELGDILSFETILCVRFLVQKSPKTNLFIEGLLKSSRVLFLTERLGIDKKTAIESLSFIKNNDLGQVLSLAINNSTLGLDKNPYEALNSAEMFYGLISISPNYQKLCLELELEEADIKNVVYWTNRQFRNLEHIPTTHEKLQSAQAGIGQDWGSGYTLSLNRFGQDLANKGISGGYSIEGREDVVKKIEDVLLNEGKRCCLLLGPAGVGKTTIGSGLAAKLFWGLSDPALNYKRVFKLDAQALSSFSKDRSTIQMALTSLLNDAIRAGNIILFIDEVQSLFVDNGELGRINAAEVIQPYLENSRIRIIGTITNADYESYIRPKAAIAGSFELINVEPTEEGPTLKILCDLAVYYEKKYRKKISYAGIKEIFRVVSLIAGGKEMPAKAIDILLKIISSKEMPEKIEKEDVLTYLQKNTKIPVASLDSESKEYLLGLEDKIKSRLIGQEEAVLAVVNSLKRALTQERSSKKPIGSFLFLGPTGVGKTELAKSISWAHFGNEDSMVRMDMSQYKSLDSVGNFIGKRVPGRSELEGGEFVKKIRQNPYSVVLLDEIEKANKEILDLFLQALDEGYINDGAGERISLLSNIIIATSNAGALDIKEAVNSGKLDYEGEIIEKIQKEGIFKPELLNRFDGIIMFKPLTETEILKIVLLTLEKTLNSFKKKGFNVSVEDRLIAVLAKEGYQPDMGARPLKRVIQNRIENHLADMILKNTLLKGDSYTLKVEEIYKEEI